MEVPNSNHFDLRNGGNGQRCNHWTSRKARNLQCIHFALTSVELGDFHLKDNVSWWMRPVCPGLSVKCAALCCSAVLSCYLLLGYKISCIRPLFLKQRNYIKLVKLNRKFSIKFVVLMSDELFGQWEMCMTEASVGLGFSFLNLKVYFIHKEIIY